MWSKSITNKLCNVHGTHWENSSVESKNIYLNRGNISLIFGQRKSFFELKKVLLINKKYLWSKETDLFTLKKIHLKNLLVIRSTKFLVDSTKEFVSCN